MKKTNSLLLLFLFLGEIVSRAQTCTAIPVLTLDPGATGPVGSQLMVAYNPIKNVYYWASGGYGSNPIATHQSIGGSTIAVGMGNQDWRGLWWNSNTNVLEGNCFSSLGIFTVALNGPGHAIGGSTIVATNNQPSPQSGGQYDPFNNHILYYNTTGGIAKYNRNTGLLVSTVPITGLPVGLANLSNFGFYTGIPGMEYAVFDYVNRRAYYINYTSGAYVSTVQFPPTSGAPSAFAISYANGLFFIFDNTNWIGYSAGINAYATPVSVCPGSNVTLNAVSANNYSWSTGATTSSIVVTPTVTTVYSVAATPTTGCPSSISMTVNVFPNPTLSVSGNTLICNTGTNVLTASGANTYSWNTGPTSASVDVSPGVTTTYTVTGTNTLGCSASKTITITVDSSPFIAITGPTVACAGQPCFLQVNGATTYSWSNGLLTATASLTQTNTTGYTVIGTSSFGCISSVDHTINILTAPNIGFTGTTAICPGGTINLTANGADTYSWSTGSSAASINDTPTTTVSYTVVGTATNNGCSTSAIQTVTVNTLPTLSVNGGGVICAGQSVTLTVSGANSYTWNNGTSAATITDTPTANTTYTTIGTSNEGCTDTITTLVVVDICTGIKNTFAGNNKTTIYPNPGNGKLFIAGTIVGSRIEIRSALGSLIKEITSQSESTETDISEYPAGVYFVTIMVDNRPIYVTKVVKQ